MSGYAKAPMEPAGRNDANRHGHAGGCWSVDCVGALRLDALSTLTSPSDTATFNHSFADYFADYFDGQFVYHVYERGDHLNKHRSLHNKHNPPAGTWNIRRAASRAGGADFAYYDANYSSNPDFTYYNVASTNDDKAA